MDARPADVWRIITGYGDFKNYSPNIVGSDVLFQKRGQAVLDLTQKCAGLPFYVKYVLDLDASWPTVYFRARTFKFFRSLVGSTSILENGPCGVEVEYEVTVHTKSYVPASFVAAAMKNDLPVVLRGMREVAERGSAKEQFAWSKLTTFTGWR